MRTRDLACVPIHDNAAQIAPARQAGLATSIVFGGVSAACVIGVPLATFSGQHSDWRMAFGAAGAAAMPASAVYVAIFNAAIGAGAMLGASVLNRSGLPAVMLLAGLGGLASMLLVAAFRPAPAPQAGAA